MQTAVRRTLRRGSWFALVAFIATGTALPDPAQARTRGGTLSLIIQPEPPVLVSAINSLAPIQYVAGKMYQGLLTYGPDFKPQPELAKSWTISPDGLTYIFELESGVQWHDGKPFTAADAAFSIGKMLPEVHVRTRAVLNKYMASVRAVSASQLEIRLKEPFPPFIMMFEAGTIPMVPRHLYEGTGYRKNPANQQPVGTDPFMFKEWKKGAYIKLVRNPDYWKKGLPYLDELVFNAIPDSASRAVAFERGDVRCCAVATWTVLRPQHAGVRLQPEESARTDQGIGRGCGPLPGEDTQPPYGANWDRLDEYVRQMLEGLGLKTSIESSDAGGWAARVGNWDFDITSSYTYQYGDPALGVERLYRSSNIVKGSPFVNVQGYNNPKTDALWQRGSATLDAAERQRVYSELQKLLTQEVANVYPLELEFPTLYRASVKNLVTTAIGLNESFDKVYIDKK